MPNPPRVLTSFWGLSHHEQQTVDFLLRYLKTLSIVPKLKDRLPDKKSLRLVVLIPKSLE